MARGTEAAVIFYLECTLKLSKRVINIQISGPHPRNSGLIGTGCGRGSDLRLDCTINPPAAFSQILLRNLETWYRWTYLQTRNRNADIKKATVSMGQGRNEMGDWNWRINIYILPCVKQIASGNLLYSSRSSARCPVTTEGWDGWRGERSKRKGTYVYK